MAHDTGTLDGSIEHTWYPLGATLVGNVLFAQVSHPKHNVAGPVEITGLLPRFVPHQKRHQQNLHSSTMHLGRIQSHGNGAQHAVHVRMAAGSGR